jgi:hypothetical protein
MASVGTSNLQSLKGTVGVISKTWVALGISTQTPGIWRLEKDIWRDSPFFKSKNGFDYAGDS